MKENIMLGYYLPGSGHFGYLMILRAWKVIALSELKKAQAENNVVANLYNNSVRRVSGLENKENNLC